MTEIPKICANCANGTNVGNDEGILGTICDATPYQIWKNPGDRCHSLFAMDPAPTIVLPDGQEAPQEPLPGQEEAPEGGGGQ